MKRAGRIVAAGGVGRVAVAGRVAPRAAAANVRGIKTIDFGGTEEVVVERSDVSGRRL